MTKQEYANLYGKYYKMSLNYLRKEVSKLHDKKFIEQDPEVYNIHRIAARALLERERKDHSLIFHLKGFLR